MHRYGEPGFVDVFGNGIRIARLEFREDSYPWDVREIAVNPSILRSEALRLEFKGEGTGAERKLPTGAIAAFDWVELASEAGGKQIRPAPHARVLAAVLPFVVLLMLLWARVSIWLAAAVTRSH